MNIKAFVLEQPQVIETILQTVPHELAALRRISASDTIYLVGSGTSMNALVAVEPMLARLTPSRIRIKGPLAFMAEPSEEVQRTATAIILSQSGASTSTIEAIKYARSRGMRTLTLTAEPDSPIARIPGDMLIIPVGHEDVGPKTKGYTASVLTLLLLFQMTVGHDLQAFQFPKELSHLIDRCVLVSSDLARAFVGADIIMVMGQGRHYGTALEGSLKIMEMSGIPAVALDTEEAFHGRFHGLSQKSLAIFVACTRAQYDMALMAAKVLSDLDISVCTLNTGGSSRTPYDIDLPWPSTDPLPELDLISAIVPFQLLAYHLAIRKGIVPENMKYPNLSQKLRIKTGEIP